MVVLIVLNFQQFLILKGKGGLERSDFKQFLHLGGCGGFERADI